MQTKIEQFKGPYEFLSNFHICTVEYEGITYPSSEHAFQAAKSLDPAERQKIAALARPNQAKWAGKRVKLRDNWNTIRTAIMREVVEAKFRQHPQLAEELLATGEADLIEGNTWNDTFWGVCRGKGQNNLGKILMELRTKLQAEVAAASTEE